MADSLQSLRASPVFKRPRLDCSPENGTSSSPFEPLSSEDAFRDNLDVRRKPNEMSSSSDSPIDINGADSGFHESLPATSSVDTSAAVPSDVIDNQQYAANDLDSSSIGLNCSLFEAEIQSPDKDSEDNDQEDAASSISEFSDCSSSQGSDHVMDGRYHFVQRLMESGKDPRDVLMEILPSKAMLPPNLSSSNLWQLVLTAIKEPPPRTKLPHVNTIDDVVSLLLKCKNIIVLTGAGVSVSCGIPDFRSRNGVYARLSQDYPDLPDPSAMFDISYFRKDPRPFFKFAKEIYPGQFQPSPSHHFIKLLETQGKLLRNYTQNIDTLERTAGIKYVIECHGSFATATCTMCQYQTDKEEIRDDIFNQQIPYCPYCPENGIGGERGILKPDIVFFGEKLSDEFHEYLSSDQDDCDLLIVIGSSLKVRPVATIPSKLPPDVPQILINREPLRHLNFDVELLGDCDVIIGELCRRLSNKWQITNIPLGEPLKEIDEKYLDDFYEKDNWAGTPFQKFQNGSVPSSSAPLRPKGSFSPPEEESNSCDYRGMSAIKLDDSQDCSTSEPPAVVPERSPEEAQSCPKIKIDPNASFLTPPYFLPEGTYVFIPPSGYIFRGAEFVELNSTGPSLSNSPPPHLPDAQTDSSCLSSEDADCEGTAVPRQEVLPNQLNEGDLSCVSNSEDPSLTASPNTSVLSSSSLFNHQHEETS